MKKLVLTIAALAASITFAMAGEVEDRQQHMKDIGRSFGALNKTVKGELPFDAANVQATLDKLRDDTAKVTPALFPAGSDKGKTEASPHIWENLTGFQTHLDKLHKDTATAAAAAPQDVASLADQVKLVGANCAACHKEFRIKKEGE